MSESGLVSTGPRCQSRAINHPAYGTLPTSADIDPSAARLARNRHCRRRWQARGFLFDMNAFYQRLLPVFSGIFPDIGSKMSIACVASSPMPQRQPEAPPRATPRPDFALFDRKGLRIFLDAKYRDAWASAPQHTGSINSRSTRSFHRAVPASCSMRLLPTAPERAHRSTSSAAC